MNKQSLIYQLFSTIINQEKRRLEKHRQRAQERGLAANITLKEWLAILNQFKYQCAYCKGEYESIEHIIPLDWGGGTTADNVIPCCIKCNGENARITQRMKNAKEKLGVGLMV